MGIIAALLKIATLQLTVVVMVKVKERELHAEKPVLGYLGCAVAAFLIESISEMWPSRAGSRSSGTWRRLRWL